MEACSNPYLGGHTVQAYKTVDFQTWENLGVALPLDSRLPGIEFRPCVVFNKETGLFVMWYEDRGKEEEGYAVAVSATPSGPFRTVHVNVTMPGSGRTGDFNIFVDDDGAAYHVRTGFDIVKLNANFTGPTEHVASFSTPLASEGPAFFKRDGTYYITAGTGCCACIGGSTIYVLSSPDLRTWTFQGDVGSVPGHAFDKHSPSESEELLCGDGLGGGLECTCVAHCNLSVNVNHPPTDNYVSNAQGSAIFKIGDQVIYLGNQWNSGLKETPPGPRNHDLLFWTVFRFDDQGRVEQVVWQDEVEVEI